MSKNLIKNLLFTGAVFAVLYPVWVWFNNANLEWNSLVLFNIFPVFGLVAFSTMWLHIIGGAFRKKLEKYFDFDRFVTTTSVLVLVSIILHPLLLIVSLKLNNIKFLPDYVEGVGSYPIWIAIIAWIIFVTYDLLKKFKKLNFFTKHWDTIKFISSLGFFLILFHSLSLGGNLQTGVLRTVWIFYGITAGFAVVFTYIIKES